MKSQGMDSMQANGARHAAAATRMVPTQKSRDREKDENPSTGAQNAELFYVGIASGHGMSQNASHTQHACLRTTRNGRHQSVCTLLSWEMRHRFRKAHLRQRSERSSQQ